MESKRKIRRRKRRKFLIKSLIFFAMSVSAFYFLSSDFFDIRTIEVNKNVIYKDDKIIQLSGIAAGTNIFRARLEDAEKKLLKDPYIKSVNISRKFPDGIVIDIAERKEAASVTYPKGFIIIDNEGIALRTAKQNPNLTVIDGITVNKFTLGTVLDAKNHEDYLSAVSVLQEMNKKGIFFKKIVSSNGIIKLYIYDQLVCKSSDKKNITDNMDTLKEIIYDLYKRGIERGVIHIGDNGYYSFSPVVE